MTKRFIVNATITTSMYAVVETPDDWTEKDVQDYYDNAGASGEFEEDPFGYGWSWDGVTEDEDYFEPVNIVLTDEDKV